MVEGLKSYAEYKESGLPWLGGCPRHWDVRRTKILFHERVQKGFPNEPLLAATIDGKACVVEYEPDSELRDFEQIPLLEEGGIEAFIRREVLPYTPDAWIVEADTKIGYEISFTRHFYQPPKLRTLAQISADILALEQETDGLLHEITKGTH